MDDIRWKERLQNFSSALRELESGVQLFKERPLSKLEKLGLIQVFEFTHELAWNVLKDYFEYQGTTGIAGSRDASREGFRMGLIADGDVWMEMIKSRNQTTHTYNQKTADEIVNKTIQDYFPQFLRLEKTMKALTNK